MFLLRFFFFRRVSAFAFAINEWVDITTGGVINQEFLMKFTWNDYPHSIHIKTSNWASVFKTFSFIISHVTIVYTMPETNELHQIWEHALNDIELSVSKANFNTWFKPTFALREKDSIFFVGVPSDFVKEWLQTKFHKQILQAVRSSNGSIKDVKYIVSSQKVPEGEKVKKEVPSIDIKEGLPFMVNINSKDKLNPRYTFEDFVIGPFNELAYSATQAILKKPGVYNPLFIYGSTGLGKTHLIQAVGNKIKESRPDARIFYTPAEVFSQEYINSVKNNKIASYKEKYRSYDLLIMDDIQFLSGKEKTQEELFHLFNILYNRGSQIIFSSDKHPNYIPDLEERLKSRFSAGMIVDISRPEFESRMAILKQKCIHLDLSVDGTLLEFIAKNVEGNIRELEGIINSLSCQTTLREKINLQDIKKTIRNSIKPKKQISTKQITKIITDFYNIDEKSVYAKTRKKEVVHVRQMIMYILREDFSIPFAVIGSEFGGRDHTTAIHSYEKIKEEIKENPAVAQELEQIRAILAV